MRDPSILHVYSKLTRDRSGDPGLVLRRADAADDGFLQTLFNEDRRAMFGALGLPETMLEAVVEQQWQAQRTGYASLYPEVLNLIILRNRTPIGRMLIAPPTEDALHLIDLVIAAAARGQGIGSRVLGAAIEAAAEIGCASVTLSVASTNVRAQNLYHRLGFRAEQTSDAPMTTIAMTHFTSDCL